MRLGFRVLRPTPARVLGTGSEYRAMTITGRMGKAQPPSGLWHGSRTGCLFTGRADMLMTMIPPFLDAP